jgi:choline kinase
MKIIIPMAGIGSRFMAARYEDPKPLIKVNGKMIIEYILDMFDEEDEIVFICNQKHLQETDIEKVLKKLSPNSRTVSMPVHKLGPVYTVQQRLSYLIVTIPIHGIEKNLTLMFGIMIWMDVFFLILDFIPIP